MVMQVGEKEDMKSVPINFPKCGNYMPEPIVDDYYNLREETESKSTKHTPFFFLVTVTVVVLILTT